MPRMEARSAFPALLSSSSSESLSTSTAADAVIAGTGGGGAPVGLEKWVIISMMVVYYDENIVEYRGRTAELSDAPFDMS